MARLLNLVIDQGATFTKKVSAKDYNGNVIALTGYSVYARMRRNYITSLYRVIPAFISDAALGEITLSFSSGQTSAIKEGDYVYTLDIVSPADGVEIMNLSDGGSGYTSAPAIGFSGGSPTTPASGSLAELTPTTLASCTVTSPGSGYTTLPSVSFSGAGSATATAVLTPTSVATISLIGGGSGYLSVPDVIITGTGTNATALATLTGGVVTAVTVTNGGTGYTAPPTISFSSGTASAVSILTPTSVASITLTAPGSGYTIAPTVTISGGSGTGATATSQLTPTSIETVTIPVIPGEGYQSVPTVTITGGAGSGATCLALLGGQTSRVVEGVVYVTPSAIVIAGIADDSTTNIQDFGNLTDP